MRIIRRCNSAAIYDEDDKLICNANVSYDEDEDEVYVSAPLDFDETMQEEYNIKFFHPVLGIAPCVCELEQVAPDSEYWNKFYCDITERGKQIQRRENVKVPVNIDIKIHITENPDDNRMPPDELIGATMKDVSAGGLYFITDIPIEPGRFIHFTFNECRPHMALTAEILRAVDLAQKGEGDNFGYGCQFYELPEHEEEHIRAFVFKVERELYK